LNSAATAGDISGSGVNPSQRLQDGLVGVARWF
jgi:hypothetical protein